jgi:hypothetical protein
VIYPAPMHSLGYKLTERILSSHRLHPVQVTVCCAKQRFNCFAVLGVDSHADARGKWWLETIRRYAATNT